MARRHHHVVHVQPHSESAPAAPAETVPDIKPAPPKNHWYWLVLLLLLIAPFVSILVTPNGRVLGHPDADNPTSYFPYSYFLKQCWEQGALPLWNPHIMLGMPFLGDGEASVFHPLSSLFLFMTPDRAMNWLIVISFELTGLFFYGYLRALKLGRPASWCGAVIWSFSNAMISRIYAGHINILLTFISIPMIMMLWERYRSGGGVRHLLGIAVGYALMILAYYPQLLYIFSLFFLCYVLIQSGLAIAERPALARSEGKAILLLGLFIVLGVGLGSIQLFPALDFVSRSFRREATIEFCGIFSFAPENLLTLVAPRFFGTNLVLTPGRYWGRNYFWEMWLYLGVLPLMLAAVGAWVAPRRRRVALLACAMIFLILGLGKHTPLFRMIYDTIPFFDIFRGSSKNTLITLFCLVTLSAHGFEALFGERDERKRQFLVRIALASGALVVFTALGAMVFLVWGGAAPGSHWFSFVSWIWNSGEKIVPPETTDYLRVMRTAAGGATSALIRTLVLVALSAALLLFTRPLRWRRYLFPAAALLVLIDLMGVFVPLLRTFDQAITEKSLAVEGEVAQQPYPPRILYPFNQSPNIAIRAGYSSAFGYTGNTLRRYNDFINRLQGLNPKEPRTVSLYKRHTPQYKMLALDAIAVEPANVPKDTKPIGRLGDRVLIPYERVQKDRLPRVFLAAAPRYVAQREEALDYVFSAGVNVQVAPAIERLEGRLAPHALEKKEKVRVISFKPNRVKIDVTATRPRELIMCGMFERNWTARVNGVPVSVNPANFIYRSVQVPAGASRVVFEYRPVAFYWGVGVTGVSLVVLVLVGAIAFLKSRPRRRLVDTGVITIPPKDVFTHLGVRRPVPTHTVPVVIHLGNECLS